MAKPTLSPSGRKVLAKALAVMRRYPETVEMDWFMGHAPHRGPHKRPKPYCNTTACLAGHIVLAAYGVQGRRHAGIADLVALRLLGIPDDDDVRRRLFYDYNWPEPFRGEYAAAGARSRPHHRRMAAAVIARVRHWLRTGE